MVKKKNLWIIRLIFILLIALGSFALYSIVRMGVDYMFVEFFGITSQLIQNISIVIFVLVVLFALGFGFRKSLNKLLGVKK